MDRPAKRIRLSRPNEIAAQPAGLSSDEGLSDSQLGRDVRTSEDDAEDNDPQCAEFYTYSPQHMYHRHDSEQEIRQRRQRLNRRAATDQLSARFPKKASVNVVDVIIDDKDKAIAALTLPHQPAVVTIGTYGAVTVEQSETGTPGLQPAVSGTALTSTPQSTLQPPPPTPSSSTSPPPTTAAASTGSLSSSESVSTILETTISVVGSNHTKTITESSDTTTTSTSTSTLEISFSNGTIITIHPSTSLSKSFSSNSTTARSSTTSSSRLSSTSSTSESSSSASTGAGGGTIPSPTNSAPSSATSSSSPSGGRNGPSTPTVVGSIIGGIAGLAIILLLLLFLIRQYRRRLKARNALPAGSSDPTSTGETVTSAAQVSPRSSGHTPLAAAVAPGFLAKWRHSGQTTASEATSDTGERGFQKLGGRKIASVLQTGGDQYGGNYGAFEKDGASSEPSGRSGPTAGNLSGASFYRDSAGFYGGDGSQPGTPVASSVDVPGPSQARDFASPAEGVAVMRPSPARTPVTSTGGILRPSGSSPSTPRERSRDPASAGDGSRTGPDALGRSLASFDGSRGSKFTESV